MSFSQQVKREIAEKTVDTPCCVTAACYGIACFGKYFDAKGVVLHTEQQYIARWAKAMYAAAGVKGKVFVHRTEKPSYEFSVKDPYEVDKLLALFSHTGEEPALRIRSENFECDRCFAAFVAAAFMCGGVVINPQKGYMLEFVSSRYSMMRDFAALLQTHGFAPGSARRKGSNVLYFKASEQIEDLLTTMGAQNAALEIMNLKVYKDFRNRANRITNCETANIDKTVAATRKVLGAIAALEAADALHTLPQPLQQAAHWRQQHPDYSLAELAELAREDGCPVSKSGLSHRFRSLVARAEALRKRDPAGS